MIHGGKRMSHSKERANERFLLEHRHHYPAVLPSQEEEEDSFESPSIVGASERVHSSQWLCQPMHGGGVIMDMDGFHWTSRGGGANVSSSYHEHAGRPCLNLLHPSWMIRTHTQLYGAMIFVFIWAVLTEALSHFRHERRPRSMQRKRRAWWLSLWHGWHAFMGYILMLIVMTYSLELLASVLAGLMVGHASFRVPWCCGDEERGRTDDSTEPPNETTTTTGLRCSERREEHQWLLHEPRNTASSSNPCCEFLEQGPN